MVLIKTLIRKKELDIAVNRQQLGQLLRQRELSAQQLQQCQDAADAARDYLWAQLQANQELQLHRLERARAGETRARQQLADMKEQVWQEDRAIAQLEQLIQFTQKQIEKLGAVLEERAGLERSGRQNREWLQLDEWVVSRRGESA
jgi:hypothetical protein